ncbi:MAG: hypothetical protein AAF830_04965 [Pseudomonadota bacterium]
MPLRALHTPMIRVALIVAPLLTACASLDATDQVDREAPDDWPFARFAGTWTLQNDTFQQVWDGSTVETRTIPNHITICDRVNTDKSILCAVDAGDFQGHILWAYAEQSKSVHHLSHFGTSRLGTGSGSLDDQGNLQLTIAFSDEPQETYREYTYTWVDVDTYTMTSRQYDEDGAATGNWYGGTFVRFTGE